MFPYNDRLDIQFYFLCVECGVGGKLAVLNLQYLENTIDGSRPQLQGQYSKLKGHAKLHQVKARTVQIFQLGPKEGIRLKDEEHCKTRGKCEQRLQDECVFEGYRLL